MPILASTTYVNAYGKASALTVTGALPLNSTQGTQDVFVTKYNTLGKSLWSARIGGLGTQSAARITTDSTGNIYVTASSTNSSIVSVFNSDGTSSPFQRVLNNSGSLDCYIVKYNPSGIVQWAARIASASAEESNGIGTDSSGNLYIAGYMVSSTAFFNADGSVGGSQIDSSGGNDAMICKYNTNGVFQWMARLATTTDDISHSIAIDTSGNVYVTGQGGTTGNLSVFNADRSSFGTMTNTGSGDAFVVKYNTNGVAQWVARIASTSLDIGRGIAVDSSGNVYVTGEMPVAGSIFNANGTQFGTLASSAGADAFVVKYNTNGAAQWSARIGSTGTDVGRGIATDSSGAVYVTGQGGSAVVTAFNANTTAFGTTLANAGSGDAFIVKYDTNGTVQWVGRVAGSGVDIGNSIVVDSSNNVYFTGEAAQGTLTAFAGTTAFGTTYNTINSNGFLVEYNSSGAIQWFTLLASSGTDAATSITADPTGNICVAGTFTGVGLAIYGQLLGFFRSDAISGSIDGIVIKYNNRGFAQWAGRVGSTAQDRAPYCAYDSSGNVYIVGTVNATSTTLFNGDGSTFGTLTKPATGETAYVLKYNSSGVVQWRARIADGNARGVATDSSGNVYVIGDSSSNPLTAFNANDTAFSPTSTVGAGTFIVKYNTNGTAQWIARVTSGSTVGAGSAIAVTSSGTVYVTGAYDGTSSVRNANGTQFGTLTNSGGLDVFLVKYDTNGVAQWANRIASTLDDRGTRIQLDASENVYVVGTYSSSLTVPTTLANAGGLDAFIAKYNSAGTSQWITRIAGTANDAARGVAVDSLGNVYVAGDYGAATITIFNANATAYPITLASGGSDGVVVKFNTNGVVQWVARMTLSVTVYDLDVDSSGNVYVVTRFSDENTITVFNSDGSRGAQSVGVGAGLIKYDTNGYVQSLNRIRGGTPIITSCRVDSFGNVYISGHTDENAVSTVTNIYNSDGTIYGVLNIPDGRTDIFIVKYSSITTPLWLAYITAPGTDDRVYGCAVDSSGNLYIATGVSSTPAIAYSANGTAFGTQLVTSSGSQDAHLVKYDTDGTVQWVARVGTSANNEFGYAVATDTSGNAILVGQAGSGTLIVYNADGSAATATIPNITLANVDGFIVKYNSAGVAQWRARVSSTGADIVYGVSTDSSGNVYITGEMAGGVSLSAFNASNVQQGNILSSSGARDAFIISYTSAGAVSWTARVGSTGDDTGFAIATTPAGDTYVTGRAGAGGTASITAFNNGGGTGATLSTNSGGGETFIVKYNNTGSVQWIARIASTGDDRGLGIAVDSSGNAYVVGRGGNATVTAFSSGGGAFSPTLPNLGQGDAFIVKYNTNGAVQWVNRIGSSPIVDIAYSVATDSSGSVYVTGEAGFSGATIRIFNTDGTQFGGLPEPLTGPIGFIVKYDTNGVPQWITQQPGLTTGGRGIRVDSTGNIYAVGEFLGSGLVAQNT